MNIQKDARIPQARKLITSMLAKIDLNFADVMITGDNTLVIIVRQTAIYITKLTNIQPGFTISFKYSDIVDLQEDEYIQNNYILQLLIDTYNHYYTIENNISNLVASEPVLRGNDEFENLLSLKAADGAEFFKINGSNIGEVYLVPIFTGFPAMNKADSIGINIYNIGDGYFLNVMNIFKKKINRDMKIYFRTINLTN